MILAPLTIKEKHKLSDLLSVFIATDIEYHGDPCYEALKLLDRIVTSVTNDENYKHFVKGNKRL